MRLGMNSLRKVGSPSVSEIELNRALRNEWTSVLKWLKNFDLLRSAGLEKLTLHC